MAIIIYSVEHINVFRPLKFHASPTQQLLRHFSINHPLPSKRARAVSVTKKK